MLNDEVPMDKKNALYLGEPLVIEVPASDPTRRAWISIFPRKDELDRVAASENWRRSTADRNYYVWLGEVSRDYDDTSWDLYEGRNYWKLKEQTVKGELALIELLRSWSVPLGRLEYPARTDYPF